MRRLCYNVFIKCHQPTKRATCVFPCVHKCQEQIVTPLDVGWLLCRYLYCVLGWHASQCQTIHNDSGAMNAPAAVITTSGVSSNQTLKYSQGKVFVCRMHGWLLALIHITNHFTHLCQVGVAMHVRSCQYLHSEKPAKWNINYLLWK